MSACGGFIRKQDYNLVQESRKLLSSLSFQPPYRSRHVSDKCPEQYFSRKHPVEQQR